MVEITTNYGSNWQNVIEEFCDQASSTELHDFSVSEEEGVFKKYPYGIPGYNRIVEEAVDQEWRYFLQTYCANCVEF